MRTKTQTIFCKSLVFQILCLMLIARLTPRGLFHEKSGRFHCDVGELPLTKSVGADESEAERGARRGGCGSSRSRRLLQQHGLARPAQAAEEAVLWMTMVQAKQVFIYHYMCRESNPSVPVCTLTWWTMSRGQGIVSTSPSEPDAKEDPNRC